MRDQGEQVETLRELGKTIRHLTQEEGQGTCNEREVSDFKIKREMTRQNRTSKQNVSPVPDNWSKLSQHPQHKSVTTAT